MDGITVQHAGELLFDTSATERQRGQCAETYLRSLEDVAFALIVGSGLAVSKNLPKVGNETPGADLCVHFGAYVRPVEEARTSAPDGIVATIGGRKAVAAWLRALSHLKKKDYPFWREFALREADAYLWPSEAEGRMLILRAESAPSDLRFGKPYWVVPELQRIVPLDLATRLASEILIHHSVPRPSAVEFVQRSIVAHATIFEWYQRRLRRGAGPEKAMTHLPHVTRTTFVAEEEIDRELWRVARLLMPRMLGEILRGCDRRGDVLKRIEDLTVDGGLDPLRDGLREALATPDLEGITKIHRDLEHQLDAADQPSAVDFAIKGGLVGIVPKVEVEVRKRAVDEETEYHQAIRLALRRTPDIRGELRAQAARVFPELRALPNPPVQPTGSAVG